MGAQQFTSATTVDDVVHTNPALSRILNTHGIDTCCGGSASLAEAAHVRDIDLGELLTALNREGEPRERSAAVAFTSATTVDDVVHTNPALSRILNTHGIDTCCGGSASLAEAAHVRDIDLGELLTALNREGEPRERSAAVAFTSATTVDDVVHTNPALSRVLNAHGIDTCCGGSASLAEAAHVRDIDLGELLTALNREGEPRERSAAVATELPGRCDAPACEASAPSALPPRVAIAAPVVPRPTRYIRFFTASLLFALTFGSTLGALTLATLTLPWSFLGGLPTASAKVAHGYAQVFGFAALFIMGVACHVIPRFKGAPLAAPGVASASFWLQVGGVLAIAVGLLAGPPVVGPTRFVGAIALLAAALGFGWVVHHSLAAGAPTPERFERYLRAGCAWLVVAAVLAVVTAAGVDSLQPAVWEAALWGFGASWILGMSLRIVPVFLGLPPLSQRASSTLFACYQLAVLAWVIVAVIETWTLLPIARALAGAALALTAGAFVLRLGILGPWESQGKVGDRGYEKFMVVAYAWLLVALVCAPAWRAATALVGSPMPALVLDFGRHAFTLGFLTQIVVGAAARLIPVFAGTPLWSKGWRDVTFYLLNAAVVARGLEVLVEVVGLSGVWPYISLSGLLGVGAFAAFAANVFMTMRAQPPAAAPAPAGGEPMADNVVADLLTIPGALELLVSRGLRPLQNPEMRAAMAPTVTLRQACRIHGIEIEPLLAELSKLAAMSRDALEMDTTVMSMDKRRRQPL